MSRCFPRFVVFVECVLFVSLGDDYLQHVGNAVADFLQPFGINVDINVQHKSNRVMCPGTKKHQQNFETSEQATSAGDHKYKAQTGELKSVQPLASYVCIESVENLSAVSLNEILWKNGCDLFFM